jgi:Lrp/AsnC family transcriptional regulator for asnA, asnC and gidA
MEVKARDCSTPPIPTGDVAMSTVPRGRYDSGMAKRGERRNGAETNAMTSASLPDVTLDDLDRDIIRHLQEDGRRTYREIGRAVGVSEGTVRFRARRLTESGALRIVAIADPFRLGYRVLAFILLRIEPGAQQHVVDVLVSWPEVTYVSTCTGHVDAYLQVVCRDHDELFNLLAKKIPSIGGVTQTETFMELKIHKISYDYPSRGGGRTSGPE